MATITIQISNVADLLLAESTNAARTMRRQDGVSEFEEVVIDAQAEGALTGAWHEACSKLAEKMHEFLSGTSVSDTAAQYVFTSDFAPDGLEANIRQYIVTWMMQDWLASVRPEQRDKYVARCNMQMDDLLRKLYKKEPPV